MFTHSTMFIKHRLTYLVNTFRSVIRVVILIHIIFRIIDTILEFTHRLQFGSRWGIVESKIVQKEFQKTKKQKLFFFLVMKCDRGCSRILCFSKRMNLILYKRKIHVFIFVVFFLLYNTHTVFENTPDRALRFYLQKLYRQVKKTQLYYYFYTFQRELSSYRLSLPFLKLLLSVNSGVEYSLCISKAVLSLHRLDECSLRFLAFNLIYQFFYSGKKKTILMIWLNKIGVCVCLNFFTPSESQIYLK